MKTVITVMGVVLSGAFVHAQAPSVSAAACERLAASLTLPNSTVTSAKAVAAGKFMPRAARGGGTGRRRPHILPRGPTIKPSSDSTSSRSLAACPAGRQFLAVRNGAWAAGLCGALGDGLSRGHAVVNGATGHTRPTPTRVSHREAGGFVYRRSKPCRARPPCRPSATAPRFS
jgi:hypothetical protein